LRYLLQKIKKKGVTHYCAVGKHFNFIFNLQVMEQEIKLIRQKLEDNVSIREIKKAHPELAKKEHFFKMVTQKEVDEEILHTLTVLLEGMQQGIFTEEYASVKFGEILVEKFVKNKVVR
jgi:hypothetical protein